MLAVMFVSSCDTVHTYYTENDVDPTLVNLTINTTVKDVSAIETSEFPLSIDSDQSMRLSLEIYKYDNLDTPIHTEVMILDDTDVFDKSYGLTLKVNATSYVVLGWLSYVDSSDTDNEKYYTTANGLKKITAVTPLIGGTDNKDCFFGRLDINLTEYVDQWNVEKSVTLTAERPSAKYYLVANDIEKYLTNSTSSNFTKEDLEDFIVEVTYEGYIPDGINVYSGELNSASAGLSYTSSVKVISDTEAIVAMDHILAQTLAQSSYGTVLTVGVKIYDKDGNFINEQGSVTVNTVRNELTVIRSDFFTRSVSSGVTVDKDYDGHYDITVGEDGNVIN